MKRWLQRRTLKLRLTLWYACATALVLVAFAWFVYELIGHRLAMEMDRQLRIDFDLIEGQLDASPSGEILFNVRGSHGEEGIARLSTWFEVWSEESNLLFRHWPVPEQKIMNAPTAPQSPSLRFDTMELEKGLFVRVMERPARLRGRAVRIRLYRDETEMRRTLNEVIEVFSLGLPLAVALSALGGYLVARRSFYPLGAMAAKARRITSESLSERLPNPNPHDELGTLATVFNQTLERLDRSFAELKRFTADASHELRSPLAALQAVGEVGLREGENAMALRDTIGSMLEEAQRLHGIVESLLVLARMEAGKFRIKQERLFVAELLDESRECLGILAAEKGQTITISCEKGLQFQADRVLVRQALSNIVHNAIRYGPANSTIPLRGYRGKDTVCVDVEDHGCGIARDQQARIFEPFYRVDKARSGPDGGIGLGLAIAKRSVECMGGKIEVQSEPECGSTFRITFPAND